jgi:hypothetical protein
MNALMNDDRYNVELLFDPENVAARAGVQNFLQGFDHLAPKRIENAIGRGKIILKRNVGYTDAKSVQQRIFIEGATCTLKKQVNRQPKIEAPLKEPPIQQSQIKTDRYLPSFKTLASHLLRWCHNAKQWSQKPLNTILDCVIYMVTAFVLEVTLLFLAKYLWFILAATNVGDYYRQSHPDATMIIDNILGTGTISLSVQVILPVVIVNLLVGLVAQLSHVSRFYLDTCGFLSKLLWICVSTLTTAWIISQKDPSLSLAIAFVLTLPPTLCLLKSCLNLTRTIIPEAGSIIPGLVKAVRNRENILAGSKKAFQDHFDGNRQ